MADPLLAASLAMGAASLALMLRNLRPARRLAGHARASGPLRVTVDGVDYVGFVYVADSLPEGEGDYAARVARLTRTTGVSATFFTTLLRRRKDRLVRDLERELEKAELAYTATGLARYRERLRFLEKLYADVVRSYNPYTASIGVVVWVREGGGDERAEAEAFRALLEAELGVKLREAPAPETLSDAAVLGALLDPGGRVAWPPVPAAPHAGGGRLVIVGRPVEEPTGLAGLRWPHDVEAHVAIVGPTGKGKTVLAAGIAAQAALRLGANVAVLDPKGDLASLLDPLAERAEPGTPPRGLQVQDLAGLPPRERSAAAAEALASLMDAALEGRLHGRTLVVLDEAWRVAGRAPKVLEAVAREGRSLGLHLAYIAQSPKDIPPRVAENTRTLILFGGPGREYAEAAASLGVNASPGLLASMTVGEAILKAPGRGQVHVRILGFHKYLKARPGRGPPGAGVPLGGQEAEAAEGRAREPHVQEPRPHTPRPRQVPAPDEGDPQGQGRGPHP